MDDWSDYICSSSSHTTRNQTGKYDYTLLIETHVVYANQSIHISFQQKTSNDFAVVVFLPLVVVVVIYNAWVSLHLVLFCRTHPLPPALLFAHFPRELIQYSSSEHLFDVVFFFSSQVVCVSTLLSLRSNRGDSNIRAFMCVRYVWGEFKTMTENKHEIDGVCVPFANFIVIIPGVLLFFT